MEHPEVWCVGGPIRTVAEGWVGRSIAAAMSTPVGVGNAMFRLGNYEGYVDTITFASYRRWVFDRIGLFDEELVRNQDDELNLRLVLDELRRLGKVGSDMVVVGGGSRSPLWRQILADALQVNIVKTNVGQEAGSLGAAAVAAVAAGQAIAKQRFAPTVYGRIAHSCGSSYQYCVGVG